ncbi:hypothetical protein [Aeribacillus sp. FSL K6-1121]|uniref:hypothetical protein n=1 Tax=Aeribacillus sp. FSL K6-1121 TaxID=2954745 RepID=UPI004046F70A
MGKTPLSTACYFGYVDISRVLLNNGAKINEICMDQAYNGWDGHIQIGTLNLSESMVGSIYIWMICRTFRLA